MKRRSLLAFATAFAALGTLTVIDGIGSQALAQDKGTVLVAGASGRTGSHVMNELVAQGYTARGMTRNIESAQERVPGDFEWVTGDVRDVESMRAAFEGVDMVISTIGASGAGADNSPEFVDYGGVKNLVDLAVENGVTKFVLTSSMGATDDNPETFLNKNFGNVLIWKLKGENHLRDSGLNYTVVRPGGLIDDAYEPGTRGMKFDQGDKSEQGVVHRKDVAAILVAALGDEGSRNKTFEVVSSETGTPDDWRDGWFAELAAD